ncbi:MULTISPECIES: hypothetical protein [unclassified Streptomyces]|uniref:hypothetical protein n=1 Tax=unclassified Streptomyces TaxID=2593676 RepID=UPI0004C4E4C7|nr:MULTISPECIES: hypothetical protein [unclassified Streptomyces]KOV94620.1 hypothetical protein ADL02_09735 [Streptomyces sp. NRRL WC-3723]
MTTARNQLNTEQAADVAHELFEAIRKAAWEKASNDFDDYDRMLLINDMTPSDALAELKDANLPSRLIGPIAAALELLAPDTYAPRAEQTPASGTPNATADTDVLWQNLTDALNALIAAGQFPDFHNLYGPLNDWQHQPYASTAAHAHAAWVVLDLSTRRFTVSSRERALSGEHSRRPPRNRD